MCSSIPKTFPCAPAWAPGQDPSFPGCCHRSVPRRGTGQSQACLKQNCGWSISQTFLLLTLSREGAGWVQGEQSQPPWAGAVHGPAAALPKETQTSYPKKALFISNTSSHFCTGLVCSGQLSPPHCQAEQGPGRAFRAGLWPEPPFLPHVRPTETRQCDHVRHLEGIEADLM